MLCGVYVDFGRFDDDPYWIATVEAQLADRRGRDFSDDRWRAVETHPHPIALEIEEAR